MTYWPLSPEVPILVNVGGKIISVMMLGSSAVISPSALALSLIIVPKDGSNPLFVISRRQFTVSLNFLAAGGPFGVNV